MLMRDVASTSTQLPPPVEASDSLDGILRNDLIRSVFQPILDLDTGALFGFEALARGPEGSSLRRPDALFSAARTEGRLGELDRACQRAAVSGADSHGIQGPLTLFVNAEPDTVGFGPLPPIGHGVRGIVELTERTLTSRLPELLPAVERARAAGWGIALDDVGADTRSLALMPVLRPDVIKLDLRLVQEQPTPEIAAIAGAVGAQAERTGATILAEGIETAEQAQYARALGATAGQGYHFGRPAPVARRVRLTDTPVPIWAAPSAQSSSAPFELASARRPRRRATAELLAEISSELVHQAARGWDRTSLMIRSVPPPDTVTLPELPAGNALARIDDVAPDGGDWSVVLLSAHFASMLAARQRSSAEADDAAFDFVITYDRDTVVRSAQALMRRAGDSERLDAAEPCWWPADAPARV
jgi:EAL domain-containing protein (putative c-di-GMP-specific phosphodiesterase class I)